MTTQEHAVQRVLKAIDTIKNGGMVVMVDDEDRENEGDLVFAASHVDPEKINFMTKEARGLICLSLEQAVVDRLKLPMMEDSTKRGPTKSTAFTVSIEAREGVTTGISAADRAHTIRVAVDPTSTPDDLVVPGHVFPLKAKSGGALQRAGHTEGSVDLARLAGQPAAAVICEIMNDDGTMARLPDLQRFAARHAIPIVSIADLIAFRLQRESLIEEQRNGVISTAYGTFRAALYRSQIDGSLHIALIKGQKGQPGLFSDAVVDVRVHRQRALIDVLSHPEAGGRARIEYGLKLLSEVDHGVFLYLTAPEPGLADEFEGLIEASPAEPPKAAKTRGPWVETDPRMLGIGAQILRHLGVKRMRVHMSHPTPLKGLAGYGLEVTETLTVPVNS